jgi:hypothetical protein
MMLGFVILSVKFYAMLNVLILSVVRQNVVMLNDVLLRAVAPN